jgi:chemotaxis protein CheY-P-specific phosphatase CheC
MLMMESKIKTIRGKMNSKVNMNQMMSLMGNIIKDTIKSGTDNTVPSAIASMAWNLSNDYIKLQLEIEKLELGQIIFHLQNDIIEKTEIQITPSIFKNDIILTDDIEFFTKYHDKRIYVNKIVQRILRIMSLILMDKEGYK